MRTMQRPMMGELPLQSTLPPMRSTTLSEPVSESEAAGLFADDWPVRISVILPACNEAGLLQRTFELMVVSLPARSEIVVVDNGSSDGCADFLADAADCPADRIPRLIEVAGRSDLAVYLARYPDPLGPAGARIAGQE